MVDTGVTSAFYLYLPGNSAMKPHKILSFYFVPLSNVLSLIASLRRSDPWPFPIGSLKHNIFNDSRHLYHIETASPRRRRYQRDPRLPSVRLPKKDGRLETTTTPPNHEPFLNRWLAGFISNFGWSHRVCQTYRLVSARGDFTRFSMSQSFWFSTN